ncbi:FAD-dependent oxidoreductase [Aquicoccus porphyridii]|uniref:FAD-dependent oxidoreductase n=1 Tax=Aquicoccus porphyridii TaxID=1852029 RepID=A0A5A9ZU45_9RHOB|nr:FAD-dependent oxidoreductase [Aquicoccus porphyridii]KAA0920245.1 FAD-dependent oxidoreductase [Aquicoccus porphyridii]RAI54957.1 cyclopropane-fatty-acyl-phospholipid synthase [Rhodobacteraceae bacterium AsT-22]
MSFDAPPQHRLRIAIVGGGISGLAAAYRLTPQHDVTLYEAAPSLGGHARTVVAGRNGDQPVDTGFIVFNFVNYPYLTAMFRDLDVPVEKSNMSFGATIDDGRVEYGLGSLGALFAQKSNARRPGFLAMVRDIMRFNARAEGAVNDGLTIEELMRELRLGDWFRRYYLMPICGAIWSTPMEQIGSFPAATLVRFFRNHALMNVTGQHQWWTVKGGSREYVRRLETRLSSLGCDLRTGAPVQAVERDGQGVVIRSARFGAESFDQVILACHSDDALRLLARPTVEEQAALSDLTYQDNHAILHCDETQMPKRKACWSSWVYKAEDHDTRPAIGVTYWMNRLQNIPENDPLFVSLNPVRPVREDRIYDAVTFRHPVFDQAALHAQDRLAAIQGQNRTWFAGAYLRHGFHEDGFASAVRVTNAIERVEA